MSSVYQFQLRIRDRATGNSKATVVNFSSLVSERLVNDYGLLAWTATDQSLASRMAFGDIVQFLWRAPSLGITEWRVEWEGVYYDLEVEASDDSGRNFRVTYIAAQPLIWLDEVVNAYYSGVVNRTTFSVAYAETIMKTAVAYNIGALATTANGRFVRGKAVNLTVEADTGRGAEIGRWSNAHKKLLDNLQELAEIAEGDFDIVYVGGGQWEFRFYAPQRGTDRTTGNEAVVFSLPNGNMRRPKYTRRARGTSTLAIVLGQGQGVSRATQIVANPLEYTALNHRELLIDARNEDSGELTDVGLAKLLGAAPVGEISFEVVQTPTYHYGQRYDLGDLVVVDFVERRVQQVTRAGVTVRPSAETAVTFDIRTGFQASESHEEQLAERVAALLKRINELEAQE